MLRCEMCTYATDVRRLRLASFRVARAHLTNLGLDDFGISDVYGLNIHFAGIPLTTEAEYASVSLIHSC